jgi:hypothetical protein
MSKATSPITILTLVAVTIVSVLSTRSLKVGFKSLLTELLSPKESRLRDLAGAAGVDGDLVGSTLTGVVLGENMSCNLEKLYDIIFLFVTLKKTMSNEAFV